MNVFERIRKLSKQNGVSFSDIEAKTGIGKNVIYKWKLSEPTVKNLKAVADYFGCTVDELLMEDA